MGRRRLTCINGVAVAAPGAPLIQRNERPGRAGMVYTFTAITCGDPQMNHDEYAGTRPLTAAARNEAIESGHFYLVGGGIASLAAAAFLIRDADVPGCRITILEALGKAGGSLDGAGTPQDGYVVRGGRMLESKYVCTYDLVDSIPTLDGRSSVQKEISFAPARVAEAAITIWPFTNSNGLSTETMRSRGCSKSSTTSCGAAARRSSLDTARIFIFLS